MQYFHHIGACFHSIELDTARRVSLGVGLSSELWGFPKVLQRKLLIRDAESIEVRRIDMALPHGTTCFLRCTGLWWELGVEWEEVFAVTCCKLKAYSASAPRGAKAFQLSGSSLRGFASHAMKPTQDRTDSTNGSLMVPIQTKPRSVERYLVLPLPVQTCATSPMGSRWARPASVAGSETAENVQANQASAPEEETFQVTLLSINGEQHATGHQVSHARF